LEVLRLVRKQRPPESYRPTDKAQIAVDRLKRNRKLNRTLNDFMESLVEESPQTIKIEIDDLKAKRKSLISEYNVRLAEVDGEIDERQSKLNAWIHKDADAVEGQADLLKRYSEVVTKEPLKGIWQFQNWLEGWPELVKRAGFRNPEEAINWCKAQAKPQSDFSSKPTKEG
jgi:hypothetical protein